MAVRFLPPPGDPERSPGEDRPDLAEVIEFRSTLHQRRWSAQSPSSGDAEGPDEDAPSSDPVDAGAAEQPEPKTAASVAPALRSARSLLDRESDGEDGAGAAEVILASFAPAAEVPPAEDEETVASGRSGASARHTGGNAPESGPGSAAEAAGEAEEETGPERSCSEDGVRLLARRARSSGELRAELSALGHSAHEVEVTIAEFEESCYLDDEGLARALVEKLRDSKRASRAQIRRKLRERRIADEAVESAIGELDDHEEFSLLREAAEQRAPRLAGLDRQTAERRLLGFLARRGWSGEPAVRAAREALDAAGRPSGGVRFR
ncbi:RecX family transcriptional regulator [Leucobacter sp. CSA2]|uniref:Regulatory protein RecX n=1 Tax=Leucobacter edaphi TaxID=2796472 RepID=A0A934Q9Y9_9MICO|nr:regulatory protein RecX [Leucobacter edaphi]MBK0420885.1 RecX family transcriptional regulator [Leucobacter edaphi]